MIFKKKEKPQEERQTYIRHVKEKCGHEGDYDFYSLVPFHYTDWKVEIIEKKDKLIRRTICPICLTYWEEEIKKL